ncbi:MAG: hypothetical protein ACRDPY_29575 [Streptosporangiaceae bacterium]
MIRLCSCGFATNDDDWIECHLIEHPREAWRQALAILEDMQHPDADQVRGKLVGLGN